MRTLFEIIRDGAVAGSADIGNLGVSRGVGAMNPVTIGASWSAEVISFLKMP
jgi:hypothetical protein